MVKKCENKPIKESANRLSKVEVNKMDELLRSGKKKILDEKFIKNLTMKFNKSPSRAGKPLQTKQVQNFLKKRKRALSQAIDLSKSSEEVISITDTSISNSVMNEKSTNILGAHSPREKRAKKGERKPKREPTNSFTKSERTKLEKLLKEGKDDLYDASFYKKLADQFNKSSNRAGNKAIQMEQIQTFLEERIKQANEVMDMPVSSEALVPITETSPPDNVDPEYESSSDSQEDTMEKDPAQEELEFEAKSYRDNAWYDVATFLAHRVLTSGESEVRVRFQGFGSEEDEWVNIKKHVRARSIPLEPSQCHKVQVGNLVLCFQKRSEHAMYFDAHVMEIERREHDAQSCSCLFLIRYDHDQTEEKVGLKRMCRRPNC